MAAWGAGRDSRTGARLAVTGKLVAGKARRAQRCCGSTGGDMETAKEERAELLAVSPLVSFRAALCRDVDTLVGLVGQMNRLIDEAGPGFPDSEDFVRWQREVNLWQRQARAMLGSS